MIAMLLILLAVTSHMEQEINEPSMVKILTMFYMAFKYLAGASFAFGCCHFLQHLSCAWANAAPVPTDKSHWPLWIWTTLLRRTRPRLTSETWKTQTVLITGGSKGLGAILAKLLVERGAKVISLDKSKATFKHANISSYHCDVSKQNEVTSVARSIISVHGPPTIVINNAGVRNGLPLLSLSNNALTNAIETNTLAHFWILKEFLPYMISMKEGHVVTISSLLGYTAVAQMMDYVASKHSLIGLHESLRFELDTIYKTPYVRTTLVTTGHLDGTSMFSGIHYNRFARFVAPTVNVEEVAQAIVNALERQESRAVIKPWYVAAAPLLRVLPSFVRDGIQYVRATLLTNWL